jgi:hypothetical protein
MSTYVFTYYGEPKFESPEEGTKYQAKWQAWVGGIGNALVNPGIPLGMPKTVSSGGVSDDGGRPLGKSNRLTGFSMVKADSMDAALEMAKGCPHLEHGTVDVAEAMEM